MKATNSGMKSAVSAVLVVMTLVAATMLAAPLAAAEDVRPAVSLSSLAGNWYGTLFIDGGCGLGTKDLVFNLDSSGNGTVTADYHTQTCGNNGEDGTISITDFSSNGHGLAHLDFGGTVFNFSIQVNTSANVFNLVDTIDSGNYEEGTAIKQSE